MRRPLAPYDDQVPHPAADASLAATFAEIRGRRAAVDVEDVRDVVVLVSSSRGGSSMLTELLRRCGGLLSLSAEMNPHVVVGQLADGDGAVVVEELLRDVGRPARADEAVTLTATGALTAQVWWRLTAQWPRVRFDPGELDNDVHVAALAHDATSDDFTLAVLDRVARRHPGVTATAYDISPVSAPAGPPAEPVVEMTPYVALRPWQLASPEELRRGSLVIGTPRNSFRLEWLTSLFPRARVRVLHVTRNPAAAVNGLIDGWQHPGFFTIPVTEPLEIGGYSDVHAWGRRWWKYDVPTGWRALRDADLATVCAEQWRCAHDAVLRFCRETGVETLRVRYEDLISTDAGRACVADVLAGFLGIATGQMRAALAAGVPPVMATAPPRPLRWAATDNDLRPALSEPAVWETAAALGYETEERLWI